MRAAVGLGLIFAVVLAGATAATGEPTRSEPGRPRSFVLHLDDATALTGELDFGQRGTSPGDQGFVKDVVRDASGRKVGTMNRQCSLNVPADFAEVDVLCTGVITLDARGQIDWQALTAEIGPPPPPPLRSPAVLTENTTPVQWAITGGTGEFRAARGQITDNSVPGGGITLIRVQVS